MASNIIYSALLLLLAFGSMIGASLICLKEEAKNSSTFKLGYYFFISSWVASWILVLLLIITLSSFHWANAFLSPLLLLFIGIVSLKLFSCLHEESKSFKEETRMLKLFFSSYFSFMLSLGIQLFFRYI